MAAERLRATALAGPRRSVHLRSGPDAARWAPSIGRPPRQTTLFGTGSAPIVHAAKQETRSPDLEVLLLRGRPTREPVPHYGPFVMQAMTPPPAGQTPRPRSRAAQTPRAEPHTQPTIAATSIRGDQ
ncbi:pirin-like C-terminal cupin domain-containing protein [Streptomyces sp. NPDC091972]|uniref:pirin-like C-terminal cupin domain-containing protein n=1 Tax=Streptomyces sp. NPDC091972 TaxID=3366007 RepID=UPI0038134188